MKNGNTFSTLGMRKFNDFISSISIQDLVFSGPRLTWNNKRFGENCISRKFDRALVNDGRLNRYSESRATFLQPGISNHRPIMVFLLKNHHNKRGPFRFINYLTDHLFLWIRWLLAGAPECMGVLCLG